MQAEKRNIDTRNVLTRLDSILYKNNVPRVQDIVAALEAQYKEDASALEKILDEQNKLRKAYIRFRALEDEAKGKIRRLRQTITLLSGREANIPALETAARLGIDAHSSGMVLWEIIAEVLRHTHQIQIVDLHLILKELRVHASRQAIESALETHDDLFDVKKVGREKFVSLKGE